MNVDEIHLAPILDREGLVDFVSATRARGNNVVLANGCFDLIHVGHIRYLAGAKELGGTLVVGVNSDEQVRLLKGDGRPIQSASERAEIISGLRFVDAVTVFQEPTVAELIRAIRPDFHAKGTDYSEASVPERETVIECGGRVVIVGDPKDHSSTAFLDAMKP